MPAYETRVTVMVVLPKGEPLFSEQATRIELVYEAAGGFVRVSQEGGHTDNAKCLVIDPEEWPAVRAAIDQMITTCR